MKTDTNSKSKKRMHLQPKLFIGLILLGVVLMAALTFTIAKIYRNHMEEQYSKTAFDMATVAANLIDGDTIAGYRETGVKDEYYEEVRKNLQMLRDVVDLKYCYVVIPENKQYYIWDTGEEGDDGVCDLGVTEDYEEGGYERMHDEAFSTDWQERMLISNGETYGYLASAYIPILDSKGEPAALVGVDIALDDINREINNFVTTLMLISFVILLISSVLYHFYTRRILIKPIRTLHDDTEKLVSDNMEDLDSFENRVHTGDELEELGMSFEFMTHELSDYIKNLALVTAEKERIGAELNVASQIQADMLPRIFPAFPERSEFDIYASMAPAKEVGGDFYDFFLVDNDHIALVMADVSGKGVPAALFMVIAKTLIKNHAQLGESPAEILTHVNEQLCQGNDAELFVTVWLAVIEISTGRGLAANAGHEHPAIRRANGKYELVKYRHSPAVATMEGLRFKEHEFELRSGDSLFVYTDGVPEATDDSNELFGETRMLEALNHNSAAAPDALLRNVREWIDDFVGDAPQFDDITMMAFSYFGGEKNGSSSDADELTLDATVENLPEVLSFIDERLEKLDCPAQPQMQIDVAVEELFVNIAHYAYAPNVGPVTVRFETAKDPLRAIITLTDGGVPYDPLAKPDPDVTLSADERPIGGLGIYMVKKSMDDVRYEYRDCKNILAIEKNITSF